MEQAQCESHCRGGSNYWQAEPCLIGRRVPCEHRHNFSLMLHYLQKWLLTGKFHSASLQCETKARNLSVFTGQLKYRGNAHDITTTIRVFQNNEMAAMLVYQTNPVGVLLFSYVNNFFCSNKFVWLLDMRVHTLHRVHTKNDPPPPIITLSCKRELVLKNWK